jgi:hypothetical protein
LKQFSSHTLSTFKKALLITLLLLGCSKDQSVLQESQLEREKKILFLLYTYRSSGECLREEISSGNTIYSCSKLNRGLCNLDQLVITSGEKIKILSDIGEILENVPECKESVAFSGLFSVTQTTDSEITTLKANNSFKTVEACSSYNFSDTEKLVSSERVVFLNSTRGKIGIAAKNASNNNFLTSQIKQNAQTCLTNLYSEKEQDFIEKIIDNENLKEATCTEVTGSKTCEITF